MLSIQYTQRKVKRTIVLLFILVTTTLSLAAVVAHLQKAVHALDTADFNPEYIIDDAVFTNYGSMSEGDIQNFLDSKNSVCLKDFSTLSLRDDNKDGLGDEPYGKGTNERVSAAKLLWQASQIYRINPQVILATLEKEQGLVTRTDCPEWRYNTALGYGCPDSQPCDETAYGLTRQIDYGVWHLRGFFNDDYPVPPYTPGSQTIAYNPNSDCGSKTINIRNRATAALYSYTPYQPNAATLQAAPGVVVNCGAYGNLNFWRYFTSWFGPTSGVKVMAMTFDGNTDTTGERAKLGVYLTKMPTAPVTIPISVNSPDAARIVGGKTSITINPSNWNKPQNNIIIVAGKAGFPASGTSQYWVNLGRPTSTDIRYNKISDSSTEDSPLIAQNVGGAPSVYRLYKSGRHIFTSSATEISDLTSSGWTNEGVRFSYCFAGNGDIFRMKKSTDPTLTRLVISGGEQQAQAIRDGYSFDEALFSSSSQGNVPVYARENPSSGNTFYTTSATEGISGGYTDKGIAFYACEPDNQPVYRLYNPETKNYLLTKSSSERDKAQNEIGYDYEGAGFYICDSGALPIHRLYNSLQKKHLYTASTSESDRAVADGNFRYEGVVFNICSDGNSDVFRLYNNSSKKRLYTTSEAERDKVVDQSGFRYEGVVFSVE